MKTFTEEQIKEKAIELFKVFSDYMNSVEDTYCNNFDYLNEKSRKAWLTVAEHELNNDKQNPS